MTLRYLTAALLCGAISAAAQQPVTSPKFRDRQNHSQYWTLSAPAGFDSLRLTATNDGRGAVSALRYMTPTGLDCETFVSGGQLMSGRIRHAWLHRRPRPMSAIFVTEAYGGLLTLPMPAFCPVLTTR